MSATKRHGHRLWVLVAANLPDFVIDEFSAHFDVVRGSIALAAAECPDAIVLSIEARMSPKVIAELPSTVRAVATYSVGTDHLDLTALAARDLPVFNTPDVLRIQSQTSRSS